MQKSLSFIPVYFLIALFADAQPESSHYMFDKPGKWFYTSNLDTKVSDYVALGKNAATVAEWFHQNIPIMTNSKGLDLSAVLFSTWDDSYKKRKCNYAVRCELNFDFQLFLKSRR